MEAYLNPHLGDANDFIAQHIKLVHHIAKKFKNLINGSFGYDDVVSVGTLALWKAYRTFNPSNGAKWSTYASMCIENEFRMLFRNQKKHRRTSNLETVLSTDANGNQLTLADVLQAVPDDQTGTMVASFIQTLNERDKRILQLRMNGTIQRDIAESLALSQSYMSRILKRIGRNYMDGKWRTVSTSITMTKDEYLALRAVGKKRTEINKQLGVNPNTFYIQLAKWGIKEIDAEERALELFNTKSLTANNPSPELIADLKKAIEEAVPTKLEPEIPQPSTVIQKLVSLSESEINSEPSSEAAEPSDEPEPIPVPSEPQTPPETVQYVTVRIPMNSVWTSPDDFVDTLNSRDDFVSLSIKLLANVVASVRNDLTDILGAGDYTTQVQQFLERKVSQL